MTTDAQSAQENLAFLRDLVDEDWRPGLWAFGVMYLSLGVVLCIHVSISWSAENGLLPRGIPVLTAYVVLYGAASVVWTWLAHRHRRTGASASSASRGVKTRTGASAFVGAILCHLAMLVAFIIVAVRQGDAIFVELTPLALFSLQSVVWFVVHALRRQAWQLLEALGWIVAVLLLAPLVGTTAYNPAIALAVIVLMVIPGAYMMHVAGKSA